MQELHFEDIQDNIVIIKVNRSYDPTKTAPSLYDCTRGAWKNRLSYVEQANYALSVQNGIVLEVYKILDWQLASKANERSTVPYNPQTDDGRVLFIGEVAPDVIRNRYLNASVKPLYKRGEASPVKVILKSN